MTSAVLGPAGTGDRAQRQRRPVVHEAPALRAEDRAAALRQAELVDQQAVQPLVEARQRARAVHEAPALERRVARPRGLGDRLHAVVGRTAPAARRPGTAASSARQQPPDLQVEPAQHVEVLLRLAAVAVRHDVLRRVRDARARPAAPPRPSPNASSAHERERQLVQQLVDQRADVQAREVAARVQRERMVPADAVRRQLEVREQARSAPARATASGRAAAASSRRGRTAPAAPGRPCG